MSLAIGAQAQIISGGGGNSPFAILNPPTIGNATAKNGQLLIDGASRTSGTVFKVLGCSIVGEGATTATDDCTTAGNAILSVDGDPGQLRDLQDWVLSTDVITADIDAFGEFLLAPAAANDIPFTIDAATSQTANLMNIRTFSGSVMASFDKDANLSVPQITIKGTGVVLNTAITIGTLPSCTSALAGATKAVTDNDAACAMNVAPAHATCTVGTSCHTCQVQCSESGSTTYSWLIY